METWAPRPCILSTGLALGGAHGVQGLELSRPRPSVQVVSCSALPAAVKGRRSGR